MIRVLKLFLIFFIIPSTARLNATPSGKYLDLCSINLRTKVEKSIGEYRIKLSRTRDGACEALNIWKGRKKIFHDEQPSGAYVLGKSFDDSPAQLLFNLTNRSLADL